MLLDIDGLSIGWNNGVPSDRGLDCGDFEKSDLPDSIRWLIDPTEGVGVCSYNATSIGRAYLGSSNRDDIDNDVNQIVDDDNDNQVVFNTEQFTATDGIDNDVNQIVDDDNDNQVVFNTEQFTATDGIAVHVEHVLFITHQPFQ